MGKTYTKRKDEYNDSKKKAGKHGRKGPSKRDPFDDMAMGFLDKRKMRQFAESY